jgi:hypothetical protein
MGFAREVLLLGRYCLSGFVVGFSLHFGIVPGPDTRLDSSS